MRLKNVVLGYTLPKRWSSKAETGENEILYQRSQFVDHLISQVR